MDKPEILERIRKAIDELNSGSTLFTANRLHHVANHLTNDIAAERAVGQAVVKTVWPADINRLRKWCRQLRNERDAAREQHDLAAQQRDHAAAELAEHKKNVRPPSDYSDLVTENARLRNVIREATAARAAALKTLGDECEQHLQLQAEHRWVQENLKRCQDALNAGSRSLIDLLAAQFDAHREDIHDELAGHEYRLASLENRLAALKDI